MNIDDLWAILLPFLIAAGLFGLVILCTHRW